MCISSLFIQDTLGTLMCLRFSEWLLTVWASWWYYRYTIFYTLYEPWALYMIGSPSYITYSISSYYWHDWHKNFWGKMSVPSLFLLLDFRECIPHELIKIIWFCLKILYLWTSWTHIDYSCSSGYLPPTWPTSQSQGNPNQKNYNKSWTNQDNSILFEDLGPLNFSALI